MHNYLLSLSIDLNLHYHPVHIITKEKQQSPSSLIPFCEFGGSMTAVGVKIEKFDVPVCNCFQKRIFDNQLCYEVDLNRIREKGNKKYELKSGFNFLMDYNEDRQVTFDKNMSQGEFGLASSLAQSEQSHHAFVYLDTIGK